TFRQDNRTGPLRRPLDKFIKEFRHSTCTFKKRLVFQEKMKTALVGIRTPNLWFRREAKRNFKSFK
ncbi:MAG: hypothetical protein ACYSOJ_06590, partial [Planctomycetota bacterium]